MYKRQAIDSQLISQRIVVTRPELNGKKLGSLHLRNHCLLYTSMPGQNKLEGLNIKAIRQELADRTDDFRIGQRMKRINSSYGNRLTLSSDYQRRFSVIQTVLEQGKNLFAGQKVSDRIVSIDRHYLRPIIRGKAVSYTHLHSRSNDTHYLL